MTVKPLVLGPDNLPAVTSVERAAEDLPLAVLSAFVHRRSRGRKRDAIIESLADALKTIDVGTAAELSEFVEAGFGDTAAGKKWRVLMATGTYTFASEQRTQGIAVGEAKSVLRVLKKRGIVVDKHSHERIASCTDVETLDTWLDRSVEVTSVEELFED